ncbi:MAG: 3-methylornithyl-N6-L-lysine dehydrogenase PylD [Candidatus Methanomethylophilaceae archaeon]|nr:3-methylornithyl-N6-L-lysine dehydrogenase PylD [Candidatus Methanomethylophilaceae archaeon]
MTRLTPDLIEGVPDDTLALDSILKKYTGSTMKEIALRAAGLPADTDLSGITASVVPITSGMGIIGGFAKSVDAILKRLGIRSHVTGSTDVLGMTQALDSDDDLVFMADDSMFIAYNVRERKYISNFFGTALGYATVLDLASGGIRGKEALVIGAGFVGSRAARILRDMGADVCITDKICEKGTKVAKDLGVKYDCDVEGTLSCHKYVLNAAPAIFPGRLIMDGAVISAPGVPHYFDEEGRRKASCIIHDPLEIGVATMAACSVAFYKHKEEVSR